MPCYGILLARLASLEHLLVRNPNVGIREDDGKRQTAQEQDLQVYTVGPVGTSARLVLLVIWTMDITGTMDNDRISVKLMIALADEQRSRAACRFTVAICRTVGHVVSKQRI